MSTLNLVENIVFSELSEESLSLYVGYAQNEPAPNKDVVDTKYHFQVKDILQSIKNGYELDGEEGKLDFREHYPLVKALKKELVEELNKIDQLEYIVT